MNVCIMNGSLKIFPTWQNKKKIRSIYKKKKVEELPGNNRRGLSST